jgi:hypothetical protein
MTNQSSAIGQDTPRTLAPQLAQVESPYHDAGDKQSSAPIGVPNNPRAKAYGIIEDITESTFSWRPFSLAVFRQIVPEHEQLRKATR